MRTTTSWPLLAVFSLASQGCTVETGDVAAPAPPPAATVPSERKPETTLPAAQESMRTVLDPRAYRLRPRAPALVETEVAGLDERWRSMPADAPDRPTVARRLAESYVELESAALLDKTPVAAQRARDGAEKYYGILVKDYPTYAQLDEALYFLAREYELASDLPRARKAYFELIMKRPDSKYVPGAYLAFGELFFEEAPADPSKWDIAKQAYMKVISYPPPENVAYGYAWYKLAHVYWKSGELDVALRAFKKTIDYGVTYPELPGATKLAESARTDVLSVCELKHDTSSACASGDVSPSGEEPPAPPPPNPTE